MANVIRRAGQPTFSIVVTISPPNIIKLAPDDTFQALTCVNYYYYYGVYYPFQFFNQSEPLLLLLLVVVFGWTHRTLVAGKASTFIISPRLSARCCLLLGIISEARAPRRSLSDTC